MGGANGDADMDRVTLDGESFKYESQWSGILPNMPDEYVGIKIDWHDIGDTTALGVPAPAQDGASQTAMPGNTPMPVVILTPTPPVEDGNRIVLQGTLNEYDYEETIVLQGQPDGNHGMSPDRYSTFWIIVLDEPQTLTIMAGDGDGMITGETYMLWLCNMEGKEAWLQQYAGRYFTFSIDPQMTWWASDSAMPLGAARAYDVKALEP